MRTLGALDGPSSKFCSRLEARYASSLRVAWAEGNLRSIAAYEYVVLQTT